MTIPTPERVAQGRGGWWVWFVVPHGDRRVLRAVAPNPVRCRQPGCVNEQQIGSRFCDDHQHPWKGGAAVSTRRRGVGEVTPAATHPPGPGP